MNAINRRLRSCFWGVFLAASSAQAAPAADSPADFAMPPGAVHAGRPPHELANAWWQWMVATGSAPAGDDQGRQCRMGQTSDVWFLAGSVYSLKMRRSCFVPRDRPIFFPVINTVYWPDVIDSTSTCAASLARVAFYNDAVADLFVELDGKRLADVKRYRVASKECFDANKRAPAAAQQTRRYPSATDGYWIMLKPLSRGRHTLRFGGRYNSRGIVYGEASQHIEYELHVY
jgi:hypothetical protein